MLQIRSCATIPPLVVFSWKPTGKWWRKRESPQTVQADGCHVFARVRETRLRSLVLHVLFRILSLAINKSDNKG